MDEKTLPVDHVSGWMVISDANFQHTISAVGTDWKGQNCVVDHGVRSRKDTHSKGIQEVCFYPPC